MNTKIVILAFLTIVLNFHLYKFAYSSTFELKKPKEFSPWLASLKTSKANLRTGPGKKYPIKWIYQKKGWPVKVIAELEHWRKIQTIDNIEGWFHKSQLSTKPTSIVMISDYLRKKPRKKVKKLAVLEKNLIVNIIKCKKFWCKIEVKQRRYNGWFIKNHLWGVNFIKIKK